MSITKFNSVSILLVVLVVLIVLGKVFGIPLLSNFSWVLFFSLFAFLYYLKPKKKNIFLFFFLIAFAVVEFLKIAYRTNFYLAYCVANFLIISAYISLIVFLMRGVNLKLLLKRFKLHLIVLTIFNVYVIYTLNQMVLQEDFFVKNINAFVLEVAYNISIILLLSLSLIHYLYYQTQEALLLFLACFCIMFSEIIQVGYIFISSKLILEIVYSIFLGLGFCFFYAYIKTVFFKTQKQQAKMLV